MKFRKKPVVVEAVQLTEHSREECMGFCPTAQALRPPYAQLVIPTLEGDHLCGIGDWIVKGVKGEFYPIKDEIFRMTYDPEPAERKYPKGYVPCALEKAGR